MMTIAMRAIKLAICILTLSCNIANGNEVLVRTPSGENAIFEVEPNQTFSEVAESIAAQLNATEYRLEYQSNGASFSQAMPKAVNKDGRNYGVQLTRKQEDTLEKLLITLADAPWSTIIKKYNKLKAAGDSLYYVHPWRFLAKCYSGDPYTSAMCSIVGKAFVWPDFKGGLYKSLDEEFSRQNLVQFVPEFANNVKIDAKLIMKKVERQDWDGLMQVLNENAPQKSNKNRHP